MTHIKFENLDLGAFLKVYAPLGSPELLEAIWNYAQEQYSKGHEDGYLGVDDEGDIYTTID